MSLIVWWIFYKKYINIVLIGEGYNCGRGCWNFKGIVLIYILVILFFVILEILVYMEIENFSNIFVFISIKIFDSFYI